MSWQVYSETPKGSKTPLVYSATLTNVDLSRGFNSFYNIQVISVGSTFYFFRSHGRIGTGHGTDTLMQKPKAEAIVGAPLCVCVSSVPGRACAHVSVVNLAGGVPGGVLLQDGQRVWVHAL